MLFSMNPAGRIRTAIEKRNRELAFEAAIEAALGVVFSLIVFGGVFGIAWLSWVYFFSGFEFARATQVALGVTALFAVVATVSAWRRVDPMSNLEPLSDFEESLMLMGPALPYGIGMQPRHAVAGFASLLIGGPANLFDAWVTWRHRLPSDAVVFEKAAGVLQQAEEEMEMARIEDHRATLVLYRLGLVKQIGGREKRLALTEKGRDMLRSA